MPLTTQKHRKTNVVLKSIKKQLKTLLSTLKNESY